MNGYSLSLGGRERDPIDPLSLSLSLTRSRRIPAHGGDKTHYNLWWLLLPKKLFRVFCDSPGAELDWFVLDRVTVQTFSLSRSVPSSVFYN